MYVMLIHGSGILWVEVIIENIEANKNKLQTLKRYTSLQKIKKNKKTEPPTVLILHNKFIILI